MAHPTTAGATRASPAMSIAAPAADAFAAWLSERTGHHYRLPTDAEWQRAADLALGPGPVEPGHARQPGLALRHRRRPHPRRGHARPRPARPVRPARQCAGMGARGRALDHARRFL
ncbi:MAG: SUMF1/EgtB/PvdO family nonheme iron enzyme [Gemmatimonadetes bacterium]|nr:SUMF1/EgtB/PvdO family nonheme iron enzyme [Gemmatimonadota bacterium]